MTEPRPAVFLDRDGTLVRDVCHAADPASLTLLPGAAEALGALRSAGYRLVVVTNQSGVARGLYTHGEVVATGRRLASLAKGAGASLAGHYFCPHHPEGSVPELSRACDCRKPQPGMLLRAADELGIDLTASWMVGDMLSDIGAGEAVGARTVFVDSGALALDSIDDAPPLIARNVAHAAMLVLSADGHLRMPVVPCDPEVLVRADVEPESSETGVASPHPDAMRLAVAEKDAGLLKGLLRGSRMGSRMGSLKGSSKGLMRGGRNV